MKEIMKYANALMIFEIAITVTVTLALLEIPMWALVPVSAIIGGIAGSEIHKELHDE